MLASGYLYGKHKVSMIHNIFIIIWNNLTWRNSKNLKYMKVIPYKIFHLNMFWQYYKNYNPIQMW